MPCRDQECMLSLPIAARPLVSVEHDVCANPKEGTMSESGMPMPPSAR